MWFKYRTSICLGVAFLLLFSGFWFFPSFAFIFFISILMGLLLEPVVNRLSRRIPRGCAAAIVVFLTVIILSCGVTVLTQSFLPSAQQFMNDLPNFIRKLQEMSIAQSSPYFVTSADDLWNQLSEFGLSVFKNGMTIMLSLFSKLIDFVIVIFVTFYMLKDGEKINEYLISLYPSDSYQRVYNLFDNILTSLQVYVRAQLIMCCITGVVVFAYFSYYDLPYASVFAVVSGLGELIPVLGPTVASCFGVMITATQAPWMVIQTIIFYLVLTQINHNLVYPNIIGKALKLHPVATILGVVFGGELLGAAGMFLAVPCIVVFKHLIEDIHRDTKK